MKNNSNLRKDKVNKFRDQVRVSLRRVRLEMDLSQQGLAKKLGVDQSTISNWESGRTDLTHVQMFEIMLICGKDIFAAYLGFLPERDSTSSQEEQKDSIKKQD
ncbi:helix-turn-helix transcriptional regulator [Pseudoalteromonas rubra]|uniref:helix-turn-helix transcriptional regulator n=1 Tax=Pseudoalteromonas rubra TaxID=43658 RepID=UPI001F277327|nr:helix-turn-helix transcriptional regulator [Pseudoalteromonas rubra]